MMPTRPLPMAPAEVGDSEAGASAVVSPSMRAPSSRNRAGNQRRFWRDEAPRTAPRRPLPVPGRRASGAQHQPGDRAAQFQRAAPAGQGRIGHEIVMGDEGFLARMRAAVGTVDRKST